MQIFSRFGRVYVRSSTRLTPESDRCAGSEWLNEDVLISALQRTAKSPTVTCVMVPRLDSLTSKSPLLRGDVPRCCSYLRWDNVVFLVIIHDVVVHF